MYTKVLFKPFLARILYIHHKLLFAIASMFLKILYNILAGVRLKFS